MQDTDYEAAWLENEKPADNKAAELNAEKAAIAKQPADEYVAAFGELHDGDVKKDAKA
jgi:hypothetical protein